MTDKNVKVFLDVAHNLDGILNLLKAKEFESKKLIIIWGTSKTKDVEIIFPFLNTHCKKLFVINGSNPRSVNVAELRKIADI